MKRCHMQGRSSATHMMVSWVVDGSPDWKGRKFPGPGNAEFIACTVFDVPDPAPASKSIDVDLDELEPRS